VRSIRAAEEFEVDFTIRKNKPKLGFRVGGWVEGQTLYSVEFFDQKRLLEIGVAGCLLLGAALGLELAEAVEVAVKAAVQALLVDGQQVEAFCVVAKSPGLGEGGVQLGGLWMFGIDRFSVLFGMSEGEEVGFDGAGAVQAPGSVGDRLGQLEFHVAFGLERRGKAGAEFVVCGAVCFG
jgi:hypothetical protein